ncbi:hypothetical protein F4778DRAFT_788304 [Xylariomycetidae sp. FL2044]|nr:hypothetical protein F4778DRAFT_788304 [Xylariomycetidae sp. FL2044]
MTVMLMVMVMVVVMPEQHWLRHPSIEIPPALSINQLAVAWPPDTWLPGATGRLWLVNSSLEGFSFAHQPPTKIPRSHPVRTHTNDEHDRVDDAKTIAKPTHCTPFLRTMASAAAIQAPASKAGSKTPPIPPNQTLYVTNLPSSKINKGDLKTCLYMLFSTYGPVLDVVALKTIKMRGQAHVVFRDTHAATQAMRSLEAFPFLGRELYAKSKSDTVAKLDGTYKMPGSTAAKNVEMTEAQQSIFNAPALGSSAAASAASAPHGLPVKPSQVSDRVMADVASPGARGQKRPRDEEDEDEDEESDEDVAMEEDSDDE